MAFCTQGYAICKGILTALAALDYMVYLQGLDLIAFLAAPASQVKDNLAEHAID